jgi:hypothetical protein
VVCSSWSMLPAFLRRRSGFHGKFRSHWFQADYIDWRIVIRAEN